MAWAHTVYAHHSGVSGSKSSRHLVTLHLQSGSRERHRYLAHFFSLSPSPSQGIVPSMFRASTQISPIKKLAQPLAEVCFLGGLEPIKWAAYRDLGLGVNLHSGTLARTLGIPQLYTAKCGLLTFSEFYLCVSVWTCVQVKARRGVSWR